MSSSTSIEFAAFFEVCSTASLIWWPHCPQNFAEEENSAPQELQNMTEKNMAPSSHELRVSRGEFSQTLGAALSSDSENAHQNWNSLMKRVLSCQLNLVYSQFNLLEINCEAKRTNNLS